MKELNQHLHVCATTFFKPRELCLVVQVDGKSPYNGEPTPHASMHGYKPKLQNLPATTLTLLCCLSMPVTTTLWVSYQGSQYDCLGGRLTLPPCAAVLNQQVATPSVKTKPKNNPPIHKLRTSEPPVHKDAKTRASRIKA